jgi:hypothetical protein
LGVLRTPDTNPCVRQDPSTNKMDLKVTISLGELSQILASSWDFFFSGRTHLDNSHELIYLFGNDKRTKVP